MQGQLLRQLLHLPLPLAQLLHQGQPFALRRLQLGQGPGVVAAIALQFGAQLADPLFPLAQPLAPLLALRLQGPDGRTEPIALLAAPLLLLQPAAGAARHLAQPPA